MARRGADAARDDGLSLAGCGVVRDRGRGGLWAVGAGVTAHLEPLLALIRSKESGASAARVQGVPSEYDVVWGGIHPTHRPHALRGKLLTQMTVAEVGEWQDEVVRRGARSSAAGAYQGIRKTLRSVNLSPAALFNVATQDLFAVRLLERRGLKRFLSGEMSRGEFGDAIAREWASFPLLTGERRGRGVYDGDGLNAALVKPERVEAVLDEVLRRAGAPQPVAHVPVPAPAEPASLWSRIVAAVLSMLKRS